MTKAFRQGQILKLVRSRAIATQQELAHALRRLGVEATQVTLSRDIRDLGLVKTAEGYRRIAAEAAGPNLATVAAEFLWDVRVARNLIVLKTSPGHASSMAAALDQAEWPEIVGTLAGDDTVLVVAPDARTAKQLNRKLREFLAAPEA
ncbi:MAG: ArgR family transcriptional regulator [Bryobacteraceae bacterium]